MLHFWRHAFDLEASSAIRGMLHFWRHTIFFGGMPSIRRHLLAIGGMLHFWRHTIYLFRGML